MATNSPGDNTFDGKNPLEQSFASKANYNKKLENKSQKITNLMKYLNINIDQAKHNLAVEERLKTLLRENIDNANNFFEFLFKVNVIAIAQVLSLFGFGGEIMNTLIKNLFGILTDNTTSMFASFQVAEEAFARARENPIGNIINKTALSPEYKYLLQKNRLETLQNLNSKSQTIIDEIKSLKSEIEGIEKRNETDPNWIPFIATKIGEYPKYEIETIFNELSFVRKRQMIETLETDLIIDDNLKNKIIELQNALDEENQNALDEKNFMRILGELRTIKVGDLNGIQFLLGMVNIKNFEKIKKDDLDAKLRLKFNKDTNQKPMIENTGINPNIKNFLIYPPRGILGSNEDVLKYNSVQGFQDKAKSEEDKFLREVWVASGLTSSKGKFSTICLADTHGIEETLTHEGHHAFMRATNDRYKNDFTKIYDKINKHVHNNLLDSLKKYAKKDKLKIDNPKITKIAIEEKINELLNIFGLERSEANADNYDAIAKEIREMILGITDMLDDKDKTHKGTISLLQYDIAQLLNAILTFKNIEKYPLGTQLKANAIQFLKQEEDLMEKWKLVKRIFHESDLLQDYNHNNQHNRVEESISRIKSISQFTKLFPDLKNDLDGLIKKTNITYNKALQRNLLPMLMSTDTNNNYQTQANLYNCSSSHACNYDFFIKNNNLNQYEILSR